MISGRWNKYTFGREQNPSPQLFLQIARKEEEDLLAARQESGGAATRRRRLSSRSECAGQERAAGEREVNGTGFLISLSASLLLDTGTQHISVY